MSVEILQRGTLTSAAAALIPIVLGQRYLLVLGFESDNFNSQTVTPKFSDGANSGAAAAGTLTIDTQSTVGDTFTIGSRVYTLITAGDRQIKANDYAAEIPLGANLAASQAAIVAAINGTGDQDTPDPLVSAGSFAADDSVLTARTVGTAGNAIATTETFTAGTNVFDAVTLGTTTAGTDTFGRVSAFPTAGSTDSSGSPLAFAAHGQLEFAAAENALLLVPSGAVTSVRYSLSMIASVGRVGMVGR
tara:strand:- start:20886 stop:21626 length:741 start_codon:yes stop_codon:yes gene_type:complete